MTMTYYSSTFSSTSSNPPIELVSGVGQQSTAQETGTLGWLHGNKLWFYSSTNAPSDCALGGSFSDALQLGMKPGDIVLGVTASGGSTTAIPWMGVIVPTTAGASVVSSTGAQISSNYTT